jgi:hypothetical protein
MWQVSVICPPKKHNHDLLIQFFFFSYFFYPASLLPIRPLSNFPFSFSFPPSLASRRCLGRRCQY